MRSVLLSTALLSAAALTATTTAYAANLSGNWTASLAKGSTVIHLDLKAKGSGYTGTYQLVSTFTVNKVKKSVKSTQPVTAEYRVVNKVPTLVLRFTALKPPVETLCSSVKSTLRCVAPATQQIVVFNKSAQ